jgi:hypothetical protein
MQLDINKNYSTYDIEELIEEYNLLEKDKEGYLVTPDCDSELEGEVGEITWCLFFKDGTVACNFLLLSYRSVALWRCIYICHSLEFDKYLEQE